jgi:hypothetical protein
MTNSSSGPWGILSGTCQTILFTDRDKKFVNHFNISLTKYICYIFILFVYLYPKLITMTIKNFTSPRGNDVPNQFEVRFDGTTFYQSYKSIIVKKENGRTYLDENKWDYSKTTGKYRNIFLGETKKETQKKIDSGEYILTDLSNSFTTTKDITNFKFLKN